MVLSKREKYIGIGTISAVALLAINSLVINPYVDTLSQIEDQQKSDKQTLSDNQLLLYKQKSLQKEWQAMLASGLEADQSVAQSQTQNDLQVWARSANINLDAVSSEPVPTQHGPFQILNFNLDFNSTGGQSMRQIAKLLWSIESANIPIRLNDMRIQSIREGTDDLDVKLIVSALYMPPTGQAVSPGELFNEMEDFQ
ncbi:MAG TPA: hypothetical protein VHX86_06850 [Tepidisphaeraceae bacterium]|nr:hypothetical protein [Tepidisphaeraceae bacterium]